MANVLLIWKDSLISRTIKTSNTMCLTMLLQRLEVRRDLRLQDLCPETMVLLQTTLLGKVEQAIPKSKILCAKTWKILLLSCRRLSSRRVAHPISTKHSTLSFVCNKKRTKQSHSMNNCKTKCKNWRPKMINKAKKLLTSKSKCLCLKTRDKEWRK